MTLREICVLTLRQLNEDEDAIDELKDQLYNDVNEGLNDMYTVYPTWEKEVTFDSASGFNAPELASTARLVKLILPGGGRLFWRGVGNRVTALHEGTWEVNKGVAGAKATAVFRPLPATLGESSDVPDVPVQFHRALADYATFRMLGTGTLARQNRAAHFYERFLRARSTLAGWVNERDKIVNKY